MFSYFILTNFGFYEPDKFFLKKSLSYLALICPKSVLDEFLSSRAFLDSNHKILIPIFSGEIYVGKWYLTFFRVALGQPSIQNCYPRAFSLSRTTQLEH